MNQNFVKVNENILDIILDLRYASKNNFTKQKLYFLILLSSQSSI